jgi:hypothetical protein
VLSDFSPTAGMDSHSAVYAATVATKLKLGKIRVSSKPSTRTSVAEHDCREKSLLDRST